MGKKNKTHIDTIADSISEETEQEARHNKSIFLKTSQKLRTGLNSILGFSQVLLDEQTDSPDQQKEYLRYIYQSGTDLLELVNNTIDLYKLENDTISLDIKPFNILTTIKKTIAAVRPLAEAKMISIQSDLDELTGLLNADEIRIQQVLHNLLSNAVKFTGNGKKTGIRCEKTDTEVIISVWDQGIGFNTCDFMKNSKSFEQIISGRHTAGSGLGLAIIKKIITLHNGTVTVESKPGAGSQFTITIPGRRPLFASKTTTEKPVSNGRHKTILVADDDRITLRLLQEKIQQSGYTVLSAGNGQEAYDIFKNHTIDCIITDIIMPELSGVELVKKIRTFNTVIPVIGISGSSAADIDDQVKNADFNIYLEKPIDIHELLYLLNEIINQKPVTNNS